VILNIVRQLNLFEGKQALMSVTPGSGIHSATVQSNSLERIQSYLDIEHEPEPKDGGAPPAYWPASGDIRVENLSARYSPDGPVVLDNLSFHIKAGERVGVGQSSQI
jgi:ABC-type multidrug transport system fused ATPase/permease subunit